MSVINKKIDQNRNSNLNKKTKHNKNRLSQNQKQNFQIFNKKKIEFETQKQILIFLKLCRQKKWTVGFAESCTGGLLSSQWTQIAGVSDVYMGSVISYSNEAKIKLLKVKKNTLIKYGAVSDQTVQQMLTGTKKVFDVKASVAITGVAGPGGGTLEKPVGTVFIAAQTPLKIIIKKYYFKGSRKSIQQQSVYAAMCLLNQCCHLK